MSIAKLPLFLEVMALALSGCGYREVEPPRAPSREIPAAPARTSPPKPDEVRVVLDANGEPAAVTEITQTGSAQSVAYTPWGTSSGVSHAETVRPVCITPCVSDFEPGMHVLHFQSRRDDRMSTTDVQIDENTKAIRHSLGRAEPESAGHVTSTVLVVVGAAVAFAGAVVWGAAAASGPDLHDVSSIGKKMTAFGGVTLAVSIPFMVLTRPTLQQGATTQVSQ